MLPFNFWADNLICGRPDWYGAPGILRASPTGMYPRQIGQAEINPCTMPDLVFGLPLPAMVFMNAVPHQNAPNVQCLKTFATTYQ
jgi:hypothetical protein